MTIFISGGGKSGKSGLAQELTVALSGGGKRYYVATMIPADEEDRERIRLHLEDRAGMGFETIECGRDILKCLEAGDGAFLVDSVTALLQNAIFPPGRNYKMDMEAAKRCADDLVTFAREAGNAVFVSDYIYADARRYDETTEIYRKCLAEIDHRLAAVCDTVIEAAAGQFVIHKGEMPI